MILLLKAIRDLRAMGMRAMLFLLVIGMGAGTAAGISLALTDVKQTRDDFQSKYGLADLDVRLRRPVRSDELLIRAWAVKATRAEPRLVLHGTTHLGSGDQPAAEVVGMSPGAKLNRLAVLSGRPLSSKAPRGAVLEADFAENANISVGDRMILTLEGRRVTVRIRGLVRSPEYLLATVNPDYLIPQRGSLAVVFLPLKGLQRVAGLGNRANDIVADFSSATPLRHQLELAYGLPVARAIPRGEQYSVKFTNADIESFGIFAPVMGAVFALVGLLLIALSLRRLVHSQRRELGAMLAIGYSRGAVVMTVLLPAAMLAVAGAVLAMLVAVIVGRIVAHQYVNMVGFPMASYTYAAEPLLLASGFAIAATLLATIAPALGLTRLRPSEAMRGDAIASFELPRWLERASARGGLAITYAIRTLLRRPVLTVATIISMAAAIGMGASLNILVTSTNRSVDAVFDDQNWTYSADLSPALPLAEARAVGRRSGAPRTEAVVKGYARLNVRRGPSENIQLVGLPSRSRLRQLNITKGGRPKRNRILLSEQTAARLRVDTGDRLSLRTSTGKANVQVSGTVRTLAGGESFLPRGQAGNLLGMGNRVSGIMVNGGSEVAKRLKRDRYVSRVMAKAEAQDGMRELMNELTGLIDVLLFISLAVGAVFLVSSLALSFLGRQGEFATLRALGYGRRQITSVVLGESLVQAGGAAALSIPAGLIIVWPLWQRIGDAWFRIGLYPEAPNFIVVIIPAVILAMLAAVQAIRRVLSLNIARAVRARLIG